MLVFVVACRYGYDATASTDDAGIQDAAVPDALACDPNALLADTFTEATAAPRWADFGAGGAVAATVLGRLRVTLPQVGSTMAYAGFVTQGAYSLRDHRLSIEVPTMVATTGHAQAVVQLLHTEGAVTEKVGILQQNGLLYFFVDSPASTFNQTVPYSATAQRFWQLREQGGNLFYETSPDGVTWTPQISTVTPFDVSQVRIELSAGIFQPEIAPGFAEYDNLGGTVTVGAACKR
jgi:hypothetical protein